MNGNKNKALACPISGSDQLFFTNATLDPAYRLLEVYKFKFDLQPGSLTVQVAGEHQPYRKHP